MSPFSGVILEALREVHFRILKGPITNGENVHGFMSSTNYIFKACTLHASLQYIWFL